MQSKKSSSSYYQEQFRQPFDDELFLALKEKIKKDKDAQQMRLPIMEPMMDANMIVDMVTNSTNLSREMYAITERTEELVKVIKEQSLRDVTTRD